MSEVILPLIIAFFISIGSTVTANSGATVIDSLSTAYNNSSASQQQQINNYFNNNFGTDFDSVVNSGSVVVNGNRYNLKTKVDELLVKGLLTTANGIVKAVNVDTNNYAGATGNDFSLNDFMLQNSDLLQGGVVANGHTYVATADSGITYSVTYSGVGTVSNGNFIPYSPGMSNPAMIFCITNTFTGVQYYTRSFAYQGVAQGSFWTNKADLQFSLDSNNNLIASGYYVSPRSDIGQIDFTYSIPLTSIKQQLANVGLQDTFSGDVVIEGEAVADPPGYVPVNGQNIPMNADGSITVNGQKIYPNEKGEYVVGNTVTNGVVDLTKYPDSALNNLTNTTIYNNYYNYDYTKDGAVDYSTFFQRLIKSVDEIKDKLDSLGSSEFTWSDEDSLTMTKYFKKFRDKLSFDNIVFNINAISYALFDRSVITVDPDATGIFPYYVENIPPMGTGDRGTPPTAVINILNTDIDLFELFGSVPYDQLEIVRQFIAVILWATFIIHLWRSLPAMAGDVSGMINAESGD